MAVVFPDIEKTIVAYLKAQLVGTSYASTRVATKKAMPDENYTGNQIVVNVQYQGEENFVLKTASCLIEVWCDDYATANGLGLWVESKIRGVVGNEIKKATVILGPVRGADETKQELRQLDVELLVKGA